MLSHCITLAWTFSFKTRSTMRVLTTAVLTLVIGTVLGQTWGLDPSFDSGMGADDMVVAIAVQPDGKILIGGFFTTYDGVARNTIARLHEDGSLDTTFISVFDGNGSLQYIAVQPDGKILAGGYLLNTNDIVRLNTDGSVDTTFNSGSGIGIPGFQGPYVSTIRIQPDGKIIIGGRFTSYNGTERGMIARLNMDGTVDPSFDPGHGGNADVWDIDLQPDGKIVIGGAFLLYDSTARRGIARLTANGGLDPSFLPGNAEATGYSRALAIQPDGKIVSIGSVVGQITRYNSDGSLDTGFDPGTGACCTIEVVVLQPDGKILIGGTFTSYDDMSAYLIARLNSDGSLDSEFDLSATPNDIVWAIALQPDGKILMGGQFTECDEMPHNRIARISPVNITAIGEVEPQMVLRVVPNPVLDMLQLNGMKRAYQWSIIDSQGRVLLMGSSRDPDGQIIHASSLAAGSYLLLARDKAMVQTVRFNKL